MSDLLDANVLVALTVQDHVHHDAVEQWFIAGRGKFATCPVTQGALVRLLIRTGSTAPEARGVVVGVKDHPRHDFWPDALGYEQIDLRGVIGHRQVTDAYLAGLARGERGRLVTLDHGLAMLHPDVALLIDA